MNSGIINNKFGQPIGETVYNWKKRQLPPQTKMVGKHCLLEILNINRHSQQLFKAFSHDKKNVNWTYLPYGPFENHYQFLKWLKEYCTTDDPMFHTIIDKNNNVAVGLASYLRINPIEGVIEVGHIHYSTLVQKKRIGTDHSILEIVLPADKSAKSLTFSLEVLDSSWMPKKVISSGSIFSLCDGMNCKS